jgi:hypothetical protein
LNSLLNLLDLGGNLNESLVDIRRIFRGGFDVGNLDVVSKFFGGLVRNLPFILQIALVSDQKFVDILASVSLDFLQPLLHVVVGHLISHVKHDNNAVGSSVVRRSNCSKAFLASGIPNLELDGLSVKLNCSDLEIHTNGTDVALRIGVVSKSEEKTTEIKKDQIRINKTETTEGSKPRFSDTRISNEEKFV